MPSRHRCQDKRVPLKGRLAAFGAALAGSAVLGLLAGVIWAAVAPRALLQEVAHGEAQVINPESSAFVAADGWFCLIAVAGGVITGLAGYRLVRRVGWPATAGGSRCWNATSASPPRRPPWCSGPTAAARWSR